MSDETQNKEILPQGPKDPADEQSSAAQAAADDISIDAALSADEKKLKRKKSGIGNLKNLRGAKLENKHIIIGCVGVAALLLVLMVFTSKKSEGSMAYGICSTYLEMNTPYPHTLRHIGLEGSRTAVRIYYTHIDPFGEFKQEMIECTYGAGAGGDMRVTQIARNRKPIDAAEVEKFNRILPSVVASDPYRVPPPNWVNPLLSK